MVPAPMRRAMASLCHRVVPLFFVIGLLLEATSASEEGPPRYECYPESIAECFRDYGPTLWGRFHGDYKNACSNVTVKLPCHQRIASCPESVTSSFRRQEDGYKALRSLTCDQEAYENYETSIRCQDPTMFHTCQARYGASPEDLKKDPTDYGCKMIRSSIACFDELFTENCQMDRKSAKAAFMKGEDILLALEGCSSSATSHAFSRLLVLGVAAIAFLRYTIN
ncbi:uncharacterized protein LOC119372087 [Rhipicephalus sanguineus]|uniref:uncharacterized protein LOC119372087 n=1 Tax=Rhipicephalus sanguineus TaxID=34632 RepID=UPI001894967B|nr:uncharacterized protein LOC119372087 [Rhipicephalus sanguineus]